MTILARQLFEMQIETMRPHSATYYNVMSFI
jgi:hypothetical protein